MICFKGQELLSELFLLPFERVYSKKKLLPLGSKLFLLPSEKGSDLKERICSLWEQILSF